MKIRVVLADDHVVMRDGLRYILESQEDMRVVADVGDGRRAVAAAREHQPEVALLDVAMPLLNGIEALLQVREVSPRTRVLMLSMHDSPEYVYRALRGGASGYLLKESAGREVIDAVREVMAGRRYLSHAITEAVLDDYVRRGDEALESPLDRLSPREREVLQLVVEGRSSKEIAGVIHCAPKTVDAHRSNLMRKLGLPDIPALVRFAIEHGVTPPREG